MESVCPSVSGFAFCNLSITVSTSACAVKSTSGAVVRALASHQCGPSSNPSVDTICGLSLLLLLALAPRGFSPGTPIFRSPQKPTFPNSNSTRNQVDEEPLCGCTTCKSLFIYLFASHIVAASILINASTLTSRNVSPIISASTYVRVSNRVSTSMTGSREILGFHTVKSV